MLTSRRLSSTGASSLRGELVELLTKTNPDAETQIRATLGRSSYSPRLAEESAIQKVLFPARTVPTVDPPIDVVDRVRDYLRKEDDRISAIENRYRKTPEERAKIIEQHGEPLVLYRGVPEGVVTADRPLGNWWARRW